MDQMGPPGLQQRQTYFKIISRSFYTSFKMLLYQTDTLPLKISTSSKKESTEMSIDPVCLEDRRKKRSGLSDGPLEQTVWKSLLLWCIWWTQRALWVLRGQKGNKHSSLPLLWREKEASSRAVSESWIGIATQPVPF